jgi:hypothetical protein
MESAEEIAHMVDKDPIRRWFMGPAFWWIIVAVLFVALCVSL